MPNFKKISALNSLKGEIVVTAETADGAEGS